MDETLRVNKKKLVLRKTKFNYTSKNDVLESRDNQIKEEDYEIVNDEEIEKEINLKHVVRPHQKKVYLTQKENLEELIM